MGFCQLLDVSHLFSKSFHCSSVPTGVSRALYYRCTGRRCGCSEDHNQQHPVYYFNKQIRDIGVHPICFIACVCVDNTPLQHAVQLQAPACKTAKVLVHFIGHIPQAAPTSLPIVVCLLCCMCSVTLLCFDCSSFKGCFHASSPQVLLLLSYFYSNNNQSV